MSQYDQIARYYDQVHAELVEDIPLLLALAREAEGPVLELGCGTGRVLLPLLKGGATVSGIDSSQDMLKLARQKIEALDHETRNRVTLHAVDMTDFELSQHFGLALAAYNSFLHLNPAQMARSLAATRRHLQPGGRLFLDLPNPMDLAATPEDNTVTLESSFLDSESGDLVLQFAANRLFLAEQRLEITWLYDRSPVGGGPVDRLVSQFDYHYLYPHEIEMMLEGAGFRLEALYGDYDQASFREDSARLLVLAVKPRE